jgi:Glycosyltransferase family 87
MLAMLLNNPRDRRPRVPLSRAALSLVGLIGWVGLGAIGLVLASMVPPRAGDDLRLLIEAATRWRDGLALYASPTGQDSLVAESLFYSYPPLVAQALVPFAVLPFGIVLGGWGVGAAAGLAIVARRLGQIGRSVTLPAVALAPFVYPFAVAVLFGNVNAWFPLLFGLVLLAVLAPGRASAVTGGLALAIASAAKLHPATLGAWLLARRWRDGPAGPSGQILAVALAGGLGLLAASLLVGGTGPWADYLAFLRGGAGQADVVSPLNVGPASQIALALGLSEAAARTIQVPVTLIAVAVTLAAGRLVEDPVASFCVATIASLVALPVTWFHYPVALLPVAFAAATRADRAARSATMVALAAALAAAGLAIIAPVVVWVGIVFVLLAVYTSRPQS